MKCQLFSGKIQHCHHWDSITSWRIVRTFGCITYLPPVLPWRRIWCMHNPPIISWDPYPSRTWFPNPSPTNDTWHLLWGFWYKSVLPRHICMSCIYPNFLLSDQHSNKSIVMQDPLFGHAWPWRDWRVVLSVWPCVDRGVTVVLCCIYEIEKMIRNQNS